MFYCFSQNVVNTFLIIAWLNTDCLLTLPKGIVGESLNLTHTGQSQTFQCGILPEFSLSVWICYGYSHFFRQVQGHTLLPVYINKNRVYVCLVIVWRANNDEAAVH